ncbi:MAG TPA: ATP-binding protein [Candidatus Hydrogenedentes bacterium]|nr:ATP-binding protein [Candidatus Hydrogenedentota bacterium]HPG67474.1 ATP-binding protein [Candidatus Hydrogenedentota bacterium]
MTPESIRRRLTSALEERVKELTCLLRMAEIAGKPGISINDILQQTVALLIPAWQYPEIASARIVLDGYAHAAPGFRLTPYAQRADVIAQGVRRGFVEVVYLEERPDLDEGPFLREERNLINAIAQQMALIVERKQAELDRTRLESQLRHADRLATIGLLAAGVAHELNEPLGNVLGFAQLAQKCPGLPDAAHRDLTKIETASLHAREIIRKLLMFARQMPPEKTMVDINRIVREALSLTEARCAAIGVDTECVLDSSLPRIPADPAQINQVIVNLVVNALQAMPNGGALRVGTEAGEGCVVLHIEDSGTGMSPEVLRQVFVPFFTTKEVGQGTGLGLPVVHGIVTSHEATIQVESEEGVGTRVEIRLPMALPGETG